jgi:hypothetical protein
LHIFLFVCLFYAVLPVAHKKQNVARITWLDDSWHESLGVDREHISDPSDQLFDRNPVIGATS